MTPAFAFLFVFGLVYGAAKFFGELVPPVAGLFYIVTAATLVVALLVSDQTSGQSSPVGFYRRVSGTVIELGTFLALSFLFLIPVASIVFAIFGYPFPALFGLTSTTSFAVVMTPVFLVLGLWAYPWLTTRFAIWTKGLRRLFRFVRFGRGGSAQFAGFLDEWASPARPGSLLLGKSLFSSPGYDRKVGFNDDRGFLTIATSRTGKGRSAIIPNLLTWPGSALVIDPKGTNAAVTAARRGFGGGRVTSFLGQSVYVVDPFDIVPGEDSVFYNPLHMIDPESDTVAEDIGLIADALVVPDTEGDTHWSEGAQQILAGLIAHLVTTDGDLKASLTDLRDIVNMDRDSFDAILESMSGNYEAAGLAAGAAALVLNAGPNERGSLMTTVLRNTAWLDSEAIRRVLGTSRTSFDLRDIKRKPMTVYVVLPPYLLEEHKRFMRLFVNLSIRAMSVGPKPKHPVLFLLDEFFSLGKLSQMEKAAGLLAGYGLKLWPVVQNIGQLKQLYPKNWLTFIANTGAVQIFGVNDRETADEIVQMLGKMARMEKVGDRMNRVIANLREGPEVGQDLSRETGRQIILRSGDDPMLLGRIDYDKTYPLNWYNPDPDHSGPGKMQALRDWLQRRKDRAMPAYYRAASWLAGMRKQYERQVNLARKAEKAQKRLADPDRWGQIEGLLAKDASSREREPEIKAVREARERVAKKAGPKPDTKAERRPPRRAKRKSGKGSAMEELETLIGLDAVKKQVRSVVAEIKRDELRREHGLPVTPVSRHLVFTGNPGTGKTTVARIVGSVYKELGLLKKGHLVEVSRKDLAGETWGSGMGKTDAAIKKALDGILFIDEAYSLHLGHTTRHGDPLGEEVITTLLAAMENHRARLIVIAAGYGDDMQRFIDANAGLASRFKTFIDFPDYDEKALRAIFEQMAGSAGYVLTDEASAKATILMRSLDAQKGKGFGNGRAVRNILEQVLSKQAERLSTMDGLTKDDLVTLEADDIPDAPEGSGRDDAGEESGGEKREPPHEKKVADGTPARPKAAKRSPRQLPVPAAAPLPADEPDFDGMDIFELTEALKEIGAEQESLTERERAEMEALHRERENRLTGDPENRRAIEREFIRRELALIKEHQRVAEVFRAKLDRVRGAKAMQAPQPHPADSDSETTKP
ncbi:MAG: type IV secretory system conjugative DNA transfer family protein [Hyphomicrobiales bacterium]|nr:type IV secretory system conjugative DNA transfer family protein [Hyphomicrobiales bacterium]